MTDLATNLTDWLAQYPEPEARPAAPLIVPDDVKASARFFGFDPDALTWVDDSDEFGIVALLDGITVCFFEFADAVSWGARVGELNSGSVNTREKLAEHIHIMQFVNARRRAEQEAERIRAAEHAARPRVMQLQMMAGDIKGEKRLDELLNIHGWELKFAPFTWYIESENQLYQLYTLTRD